MATPLLHKKLIDDLFPSEMAILSFDLNLGFDIAQLALSCCIRLHCNMLL